MAAANERLPTRILGYVLMPNHLHLVLWSHAAGDLSPWMQWLLTSHVRRYHCHYHSSGHVWQGHFKAFPIEQDEHLVTVLRYVERNPLRAGLVERAEDWRWSSLAWQTKRRQPAMLAKWPVACPRNRIEHVNTPQTEGELEALQRSFDSGAPFGDERWQRRAATDTASKPHSEPGVG